MRGWMRGVTLKECQSDSLPSFVGNVVDSFGGEGFRGFGGNNDAEGSVASAPADNDDA